MPTPSRARHASLPPPRPTPRDPRRSTLILAVGTTAADVEATLLSFQFTERMINGPVVALSGGWKMKLALARAMCLNADILLMDEPTNHLDLEACVWLEQHLSTYSGVLGNLRLFVVIH